MALSNENDFNQAYAELLTDWDNRTEALARGWLGFAVGAPEAEGENKTNTITLFVATEPPAELKPVIERLRTQGIQTNTVPVGGWVAISGLEAGSKVVSAIGSHFGATGSAGALLCGPNGQFWLLSANHVISLNGQATEVGLGTISPNSKLGDIIHYVEVKQRDNKVDAAIVQLAALPSGFYGPFQNDLKSLKVWPFSEYDQLVRQQPRKVVKVGAEPPKKTAGMATGAKGVVAITVLGKTGAGFQDVLIVSALDFAAKGDSGSLVVDHVTKRPVGMVIARSKDHKNFVVAYLETALDLLKSCGGPFTLCGLDLPADAKNAGAEAMGAEDLDCQRQRVSPHLKQISGVSGIALEEEHIVVFLENDSAELRAAAQAVFDERAPRAHVRYRVTGRFSAL